MDNFLIYGAYGFTGKLIVELAVKQGHHPILAGRDEAKLRPLAAKYNLPYRPFDLSENQRLLQVLNEVDLVLNCAGPFSSTAFPLVTACIRKEVHYLDITGEIEVFEMLARQDTNAKEAGVVVLPGVGFDVVPTDCLAAFLKAQLPDATHLELAFKGASNMSRGTALTMIENLDQGGAVRQGGKIVKVPNAYKKRIINFGPSGNLLATTIPWGDVSTAYYSTKIPNILVYTATSPKAYKLLKSMRYLGWLAGLKPVQSLLKKQVNNKITGPTEEHRENTKSYIWGEASNGSKKVQARLTTPEGYKLTAITAVKAVEKVLNKEVKPGFKTPSKAFGPDFILEVGGVDREILNQ